MKNYYTTFYVIRHGQSEFNVKRLLQGPGIGNTPLTDLGIQQAKTIASKLHNIRFDMIISSDLIRSVQTAQIIANERNMQIINTPEIRERSFGKYEGMPIEEFLKLYKDWGTLKPEDKFEFKIDSNEESFSEGYQRFSKALFNLAKDHPGKTILVVTHGGMIRGLLIKNGYGDFERVGGIENCGFVKVISDGTTFQIQKVEGLKSWKDENKAIA